MTQPTPTGSPSKRSYSNAQHGRMQQLGNFGDYTLQPSAGVDIYRPSWEGKATTIRIYPALCPENPSVFDPWRLSNDDDSAWGDWVRTYPAVRNFGDPGLTFILYNPADPIFDARNSPAWILYYAIDQAIKSGQERPGWAAWQKSIGNKSVRLSKPTSITLLQGGLMEHGGKEFNPPKGGSPGDSPVVLQLSYSAGRAMFSEMNNVNPEFRGDPSDWEGRYVNGDPVALHSGGYVTFFQAGHDPRQARRAEPARRTSTFGQRRDGGRSPEAEEEKNQFDCFIARDWRGIPASLSSVEDMIRAKWRPWDSIIRFLTIEEQIRLMAGSFPPDMMVYAFGNGMYRDLLPEEVFRRATEPKTFIPGGSSSPTAPAAAAAARDVAAARGAAGDSGAASEQAPFSSVAPKASGQAGGWGAPREPENDQVKPAGVIPSGEVSPGGAAPVCGPPNAAAWRPPGTPSEIQAEIERARQRAAKEREAANR